MGMHERQYTADASRIHKSRIHMRRHTRIPTYCRRVLMRLSRLTAHGQSACCQHVHPCLHASRRSISMPPGHASGMLAYRCAAHGYGHACAPLHLRCMRTRMQTCRHGFQQMRTDCIRLPAQPHAHRRGRRCMLVEQMRIGMITDVHMQTGASAQLPTSARMSACASATVCAKQTRIGMVTAGCTWRARTRIGMLAMHAHRACASR